MSRKQIELPQKYSTAIEQALAKRGYHFKHPHAIADCIHAASDFYIENPESKTPWQEEYMQVAYLAYYFPLNYLRNVAIIEEAQHFDFFKSVKSVCDYGAAMAVSSLALFDALKPTFPIHAVEIAQAPQKLFLEIGKDFSPHFHERLPSQNFSKDSSLLLLSYVYTELSKWPQDFSIFSHLLIVEPSTRQDGRRLLELRKLLLAKGYHVLAPCTHQQECPLLKHSAKDWCHDKISFERPKWLKEIELHLPFQNEQITFSYLLMSRDPQFASSHTGTGASSPQKLIRITGDLQKEKGKSKQMICRSSEREFLSWLKKEGEPPEVYRGQLIEDVQGELKGTEIRLNPQDRLKVLR